MSVKAVEIWHWVVQHEMVFQVIYITGSQNVQADYLNKALVVNHE